MKEPPNSNNRTAGSPRLFHDEALQAALGQLQDGMATVDLLLRPNRGGSRGLELLLKEMKLLRVRMDGNPNHVRAHLHIDYHRETHLASYAVDDGSRLAGKGRYDGVVQPWIERNRERLMKVWRDLRAHGAEDTEVAALRGSEM